MASHCLVVYSSPAPGREAAYNKWYNEQHIPDVLKVPGFVAAQRFRLPEGEARYLALYELETDDPDAVMAELQKRAGTPDMVMSDAMDLTSISMTLTAAASPRIAKA